MSKPTELCCSTISRCTVGFDISLAQIFYCLANGGTLIITDTQKDPEALAAIRQDVHDAKASLPCRNKIEYSDGTHNVNVTFSRFYCLANGGTLIITDTQKDPEALATLIGREKVTF
jgi:putative hemolysin